MKKLLPLLLLSVLLFEVCEGQNPLVKIWDYRYGGSAAETLMCVTKTNDGGYLLGGFTTSDSSGDMTQHNWAGNTYDYWIVKTDSFGIKQWDKRYGGTKNDYLFALQQTSDGGYILGGYSLSDSSGDRTASLWGGTGSFGDYWIIKIDSIGNKQWDKRYGGDNQDQLHAIQQTTDGGYILGGWSWSGISGDKTQANRDTNCTSPCNPDYWIVKTDPYGVKLWDKRFGGVNADYLSCLQQCRDGGYILGGYSDSGMDGDISQPSQGSYDYWVVKTDSLGIKQWDKRFGGTNSDALVSLRQTIDGGYILGGYSSSQPVCGASDYWIVKIDSLGIKEWDKIFGGSNNEDEFGNIIQTMDGGYLIAGTSYSNISCSKTENNIAREETWFLKIDSLGVKQWDKTASTSVGAGDNEQGLIVESSPGCYIVANFTYAGVGGYKTQPSQGGDDYWIVKFCDTTEVGIPEIPNAYSPISIYPNPFTNELIIKERDEQEAEQQVILYDVAGKEILRSKTKGTETKFNTEGIAAGFYIVRVGGENFKVIKEQ